jgi:uncharacterized protein YbaP (TraB family)
MRPIPAGTRLLLALLVWLLPACAGTTAAPGAGVPTPALWRAEPPGPAAGELFLLGSVHMGTDRAADLGPLVDAAFESADELVVEIDTTRLPAEEVAMLAERYGSLPPDRLLSDVLTPVTRASLDAWLARRELPAAQVEHLEPWFVSFLVAQVELQQAGYAVELGVDHVLMDRARGRKPIVAIESPAGQLELMDALPREVQDLMLRDVLTRADDFAEDVGAMVEAWRRGDVELLHELVFSTEEELPDLEIFYERVFYARNESMAASLARLAGDGRTRLVVLGSGHMLGERGVPALLERRGYRVLRVRSAEELARGPG